MAISQLPQAPYRQDRKVFPTPIVGDVLFSEVRDCNRGNAFPEYGTPHPNTQRWQDHKLVFIKPVDIERNEIFEFFYAADRENQDLYNFSFGLQSIGPNRQFRAVQRTYITLRDNFQPMDIEFGTPMPDIPEGKFDGVEYVFFQKQQQRIDQQELDSIYVAEVHTYIEKAFLDDKLSYATQRTDPLPEKFQILVPEQVVEQIVEGTAEMPVLTGSQLSVKEDQLNPDVKLVRTATRDRSTLPVSLDQKNTTNEKQLASITQTVQSGDTVEEPSATVDIQSEALGDGTYVVTKTEVPELFTAETFVSEVPDVVPQKFRVAVPTTTTEERVEGVAEEPVLLEGDLAATEQQENKFVKRVRKTKRDIIDLPVELTQKETTNDKQLATVSQTLQNGDTTEAASATVDIQSEALGDGTYVVTKVQVPEVFSNNVFGVEIIDPLPDRFRSAIPTITTETTVAGVASTPILTGSEISATEQQINKFVKRTRSVSRDRQTSGVTLNGVNFDSATGRPLESDEIVYPKGSDVNGFGKIEDLFADPTNAFWGQQPDGSFLIGEQISDDWFIVKKQYVAPTNAANSLVNPAKKRFIQRITPLDTDILFYEIGSMPIVTPAYGTPHYDVLNWPNHKLIYMVPEGDSGLLYRFFYAADREDQDLYNFVDEEGRALTRTYIIPRSQYLDRASYNATIPTVGLSADPQFGSSDAVYGGFVFAGENVERAPEPLDNLYVVIERVYLPKVRTAIKYDDNIEKAISVTQTVIKKGTGPTVQNSIGVTVQVENVNNWYDIETVSRVIGLETMFDSNGKFIPIRLPDVPKDVDYNFPNKLNSVNIKFVTAYTIKDDSTINTDVAYYIDYDLQSPPTGPYAARLIRFLTDDPQSIREQYPVVQLHPKRETIGIATTIGGNASAQQIELPPSIHGPIDITVNGEDVDVSALSYAVSSDLPTSDDFFTLLGGGEFVAGYEVSKTVLNLYEVSVILINIDGLYSNKFVTSYTGQTRVKHILYNFETPYEIKYAIRPAYPTGNIFLYYYTQKETSVTFTSDHGTNTIVVPQAMYYAGSYSQFSTSTIRPLPEDRNKILTAEEWTARKKGIPYTIQLEAEEKIGATFVPKYRIRQAASAASKLQLDKNLNTRFIFDSEGTSLTATAIKSPAPSFSFSSPTAGNSVETTTTL